ncbi:hypothetical protein [Pseudophaeobacter sp.]|uniref:hypothetical protein n=1 Tax=Pseudophaeobacter sp. TaxID=1971739 RepID=UPI00329A20AC
MLFQNAYQRIYRISAWYDLAVTWPYATPLTFAFFWQFLDVSHAQMGLAPLPEIPVYGILFANFFGTVVLIWSIVRLKINNPALARYDAAGRWLFSAWMINALWQGASPLLWGFLIIEIGFAILQSLPIAASDPSPESEAVHS